MAARRRVRPEPQPDRVSWVPCEASEGRLLCAGKPMRSGQPLVRQSGVHALAQRPPNEDGYCSVSPALVVDTVKVENAPVALVAGDMRAARWSPQRPKQGELFGAPRMLDGTGSDVWTLGALAGVDALGDSRMPLRSDTARLGLLAHALAAPVVLSPAQGAWFISGRDTPAARSRWHAAVRMLWTMTVHMVFTQRLDLAVISWGADGRVQIGPPLWIADRKASRAYRLTGGLLRPALQRAELAMMRQGAWRMATAWRMVNGIEAGLSWGTTRGRGRGGRDPLHLTPASRGGPGPVVEITWRNALRLAGEHVKDTARMGGAESQRYRKAVERLLDAGYGWRSRRPRPAQDTIEIEPVKGSGGSWGSREPVLWVRASAEFCEAVRRAKNGSNWERLPLIPFVSPQD